jgi:ADP-dependent phosphofructokinase/glucokinase
MTQESWVDRYTSLLPRISAHAPGTPLILCGLASCADAYLRLAEAEALFAAKPGTEPNALAQELIRRTERGSGGEFFMDWPDAGTWIEKNLRIADWGLGGTGAQAAQTLAILGARALISLEDRSERKLSVIHPDVLVADSSGAKRRGELSSQAGSEPVHYIFEVAASEQVGPVRASRSTRIIVRFAHHHLDRDPHFVRVSQENASTAGAAVVCGFNELADESLSEELEHARKLLSGWRERGLALIHLELGGYESIAARDQVLSMLGPVITSLGMSHTELRGFGKDDAVKQASQFVTKFDLRRVCVHADHWALTVTRDDAETELESLLCGCLLASCRAESGAPCVPTRIPAGAIFSPPDWPLISRSGNHVVVCCAAPYLERPTATIGLGDTFLAGTLLVLGQSPSTHNFSSSTLRRGSTRP